MAIKTKTIGLLRFSVLTPDYYAGGDPDIDKIAAHLFSPERMELRFRIFEKLCLPSLISQSDDDFEMIILTAESLPPQHMERLLDLLDPWPNLHCMPVGPSNHYKLLQEAYAAVPLRGASHKIAFRLDDDDAVDRDFIKRTKHLAHGMIPLLGRKTPFIIAYNRGFYVRTTGDEVEIFDACEKAPLSTGTTLVTRAGDGANPYRFNHRKLSQHFNVLTDISVPSFVRTIHGDNKSNPTQMGITHKMKPDQIEAALDQHFGLSMAALRAL